MKVLVCGGRDYKNSAAVFGALDDLHSVGSGVDAVIHGACRGADLLGKQWADLRGVPDCGFPADWSQGARAGPMRNQKMLDEAAPDVVLAFPGGRGTADMLSRARRSGVTILVMPS